VVSKGPVGVSGVGSTVVVSQDSLDGLRAENDTKGLVVGYVPFGHEAFHFAPRLWL
jgi:hypothetical protein